jgi:hypothetical protein
MSKSVVNNEAIKLLERLKKKELIGYIYLMQMAEETRPYQILHASIDTKKKYEFIVDKKSTRWDILTALFRMFFRVLNDII